MVCVCMCLCDGWFGLVWCGVICDVQFIAVVHDQSKFWKVTDLCLDHLIRMAKKSRAVLDWLVANPKYLDNMIGWLHAYPEPPAAVPSYLRDREPTEAQAIVLLKPAPERSYAMSSASSVYGALGALMSMRGNMAAPDPGTCFPLSLSLFFFFLCSNPNFSL